MSGSLYARRMNRVALHESAGGSLPPPQLVDAAAAAKFDAVGLRVAAVPTAEEWWTKGAGSAVIGALIDRLLVTRTAVLDVGRVPLDAGLHRADYREVHSRVLDLGQRLGAQFVTARAGDAAAGELFVQLAALSKPYQLRPLLAAVPGTAVPDLDAALAVVSGSRGGVVLDLQLSPGAIEDVDTLVARAGDHLGYVRLDAAELASAPDGALATLPQHVPVAVGAREGGAAVAADNPTAHAVQLRRAVDRLLEHPRARAARLGY